MKCYKPILINPDIKKYPNGILVPCRHCLACQEERKKELAIRFIHETWSRKKDNHINVMVLLTYREEDYNAQLDKTEFKAYLKRIREHVKYHTGELPRYVASGEYGETGTKRAHYHIIMNIPNSNKIINHIEKSWKKGFVNVIKMQGQQVEGIFYTTGYVAKKMKEERKDGRQKEFHLMSRGNGRDWIEKNKTEIKEKMHLTFKGHKINLPIYYLNKLDLSEFEKFEIARKSKKYNEGLHREYVKKYGGKNHMMWAGEIYNENVEYIEMQALKQKELEYKIKYDRKQRGKHAI